MIRRAVLIGAPSPPRHKEAPGCIVDIVNLNEWLRSDEGGAWNSGEINALLNPSAEEVRAAISWASGADYAFVTFSGHGGIVKPDRFTMTQIVIMGKGEEMNWDDLRPDCDRAVLICDACRVVEVPEQFTESITENRGRVAKRAADRNAYRQAFESIVADTDEGAYFMFGCSIGQKAGDSALNGGTFTHSLLVGADGWLAHARPSTYLSAEKALERAKILVQRKRGDRQIPQGGSDERCVNDSFPFAIRL